MNNSFLLLAGVIVAAALGLFLLATPADPAAVQLAESSAEAVVVAEAPQEVIGEEGTGYSSPASTAYVEPVAASYVHVAPCTDCGFTHAVRTTPAPSTVTVRSVVPCVAPANPCGRSACTTCHPPMPVAKRCPGPVSPCGKPSCTVCHPIVPVRCPGPVTPCGEPRCTVCHEPEPAQRCVKKTETCPSPVVPCADRCDSRSWYKPGINRNLPVCVDECAFLQLHTTVHQPICPTTRFQWAANRGRFLDPTASDPIYYAPEARLSRGEDVVITLTITDRHGVQFTDHVVLHIRNIH